MIEKGILTENDRVELIHGEIVQKLVIGTSHIACVNRLTNLLVTRLQDRLIVSVQNPIVLSDSQPEPDVVIVATARRFLCLDQTSGQRCPAGYRTVGHLFGL